LGFVAIYASLGNNSIKIVNMYHVSSDVVANHFDIKEYEFSLNQNVKYSTFKAFKEAADNSFDCKILDRKCNLNLGDVFKKYFLMNFDEAELYDINVAIQDGKFAISGKHKNRCTSATDDCAEAKDEDPDMPNRVKASREEIRCTNEICGVSVVSESCCRVCSYLLFCFFPPRALLVW